jgi:beta-aspartyl-dipeptidase (metallo-type)
MLDNNLPLEKILPLMTSNVASLFRFHRKGQIATGFDADLLVLDESHRIDSVMANGVWHLKQGQQLVKGLFEQ